MITKYEIAATKNGQKFIVAYTARVSKSNLIKNVCHYGHQISLAIGADAEAVCLKADKNEVVMSDGTRIFYTGRTELDAERAA
jgi:hypothetical protein